MHKTIAAFFWAILLYCANLPSADSDACTIGIADGTVSADGRPLLWKSRMVSNETPNELVHVTGGTYAFLGIRGHTGRFMMGLNTAGLSTGNTLVGRGGDDNGPLMQDALAEFDSVDQVRQSLAQRLPAGELAAVSGCFPFLDASGKAAMFEVAGSNALYEYVPDDPDRAAQNLTGRVVRANEFHRRTDGADNTSIRGRYQSGSANTTGLISIGKLSARTIMQGDRDSGYEFMRYGPDRPLSTIAVDKVCSAIVVHGVAPGEDPLLTTMWTMLGHSNYGISVPVWACVAEVPECLANGEMASRANSLMAKRNEAATQASTLPLEAHLFDEVDELLEHWRSVGAPAVAEMSRVQHAMTADAYSLLTCLDTVRADNKAPVVDLQAARASDRSIDFAVEAVDPDGTIGGYRWAFGDGCVSREPTPSHTYRAPGWYLVSCTVVDDDGVSVTDWQYFRVTAEPATCMVSPCSRRRVFGGTLRERCRQRPHAPAPCVIWQSE